MPVDDQRRRRDGCQLREPFSTHLPLDTSAAAHGPLLRQRISEGPLVGDFMSGLTAELCVSKSVRDTAALLEAVHGPAPGDPYVAPPPLRP